MPMTRAMALAAALVALTSVSLAQEPVAGDSALTLQSQWQLNRADYTREVWIGLGTETLSHTRLLQALAAACDDTTSTAAISVPNAEALGGLALADEKAAVGALSGRMSALRVLDELGLWGAQSGATPSRAHVRVVLVGVMESCASALRAAASPQSEIDGVVLIDPPAGDLPQIEEGARAAGVDVLLHPRSEGEFRRDETEIRKRLGPWGKSARVMRGPDPFATLDDRLAWAWRQLRGYDLSVPDALGEAQRGVSGAQWEESRGQQCRVVHVGELHGNPGAHRLQLELLRAMIAHGGPLVLSTEQFERDVQPVLDRYLKGEITEAEFLRDARPWPNYADYRPMIELCRAKGVAVIAGNIPRRLASRVHREGPEVIEKFTDEEKAWTAATLNAPKGAYRDKFMQAMGGTDGHNARLESMFAAQCIKDDTMAESIAAWLAQNPTGRVLHINGSFHSASGLGVPERLALLVPGLAQGILTCVERGQEPPVPVDGEWIATVPASRPR